MLYEFFGGILSLKGVASIFPYKFTLHADQACCVRNVQIQISVYERRFVLSCYVIMKPTHMQKAFQPMQSCVLPAKFNLKVARCNCETSHFKMEINLESSSASTCYVIVKHQMLNPCSSFKLQLATHVTRNTRV